MADADGEEMNFRRAASLIVVADFEVTFRSIQIKRRKSLRRLIIQAQRQDVVLVAENIGEFLADGDSPNIEENLVAACPGLFNTQCELTLGVVVKLTHGLGADALVDMNLADNGTVRTIVGLWHGQ